MNVVHSLGSRLAIVPSRLTATTIVGRAVLAGIVGGLGTALFLALVGESSIRAAIAVEESNRAPTSGAAAITDVSRGVQVAGGLVAVVLFGILNGIIFGTVLATIRHRIALADDLRRSLLLAGVGFVSVAVLPAVKYPANPPGVGDPNTITTRTVAYLTLLAASLALVTCCALIYRRLHSRLDQPSAIVVTTLVAVVGYVLLGVLWPQSPDQVPTTFPADLLWRFRLESLAALLIQWAALGLGTGWLLTRFPETAGQ